MPGKPPSWHISPLYKLQNLLALTYPVVRSPPDKPRYVCQDRTRYCCHCRWRFRSSYCPAMGSGTTYFHADLSVGFGLMVLWHDSVRWTGMDWSDNLPFWLGLYRQQRVLQPGLFQPDVNINDDPNLYIFSTASVFKERLLQLRQRIPRHLVLRRLRREAGAPLQALPQRVLSVQRS